MTLVNTLNPTALGLTYSAVYNGYMFIEMAITAVVAFLIANIPSVVRKQTN